MKGKNLLRCEDYDPNGFIDWVKEEFECKSDGQLAGKLGSKATWAPILSCMRNKKQAISDSLLVMVSDYTGMGTSAIKARMFRE